MGFNKLDNFGYSDKKKLNNNTRKISIALAVSLSLPSVANSFDDIPSGPSEKYKREYQERTGKEEANKRTLYQNVISLKEIIFPSDNYMARDFSSYEKERIQNLISVIKSKYPEYDLKKHQEQKVKWLITKAKQAISK